jgi:hypothetical protein
MDVIDVDLLDTDGVPILIPRPTTRYILSRSLHKLVYKWSTILPKARHEPSQATTEPQKPCSRL